MWKSGGGGEVDAATRTHENCRALYYNSGKPVKNEHRRNQR
jgi:hypothetical protein